MSSEPEKFAHAVEISAGGRDVSTSNSSAKETSTADFQASTDDAEKADSSTKEADDGTDYISGFKLAVVVVSVSLACFLTVLDISVISTVSSFALRRLIWTIIDNGFER